MGVAGCALLMGCTGAESEPSPAGGGGAAGTAGSSGGVGGGSLLGGAGGLAANGGAAGGVAKARGAFSLHIVPGEGCSLTEQWVDFPVVDGGHPVTATETVQTIDDGATMQVTNAAGMLIDTTASRLACTWVPEPILDLHVGFRFGPASREGTLSMSPSLKLDEPDTSGILIVGQDWDEKNYGGQCTFTAREVDHATRSVRGEVSCTALDRVTDMPDTAPPEACTLPSGYFAFENCSLPD
jgi:hypothetical protein